MEEGRSAFKIKRVLVGKTTGKKALGWPNRRWKDNRRDLKEILCQYEESD